MTVRERIEKILDPNNFIEMGRFVMTRSVEYKPYYGDGVVTGYGKIEGRPIIIYAQGATVLGGSMGKAHCESNSCIRKL